MPKDAERMLVRANGKLVGDGVGRRQVSTCIKMDSVVTKLNKDAERILDPANSKPCQTQCRARASEKIRGLRIGRVLTA